MPLHIGNTNIGAIYKGTTPISSIYKGTTLVYSSFSWQEWYNEYIYNAIIPTTLPKNLFDGEWQKGAWVNGSYVSSADGVASVNYISVKPNTTYYFNLNLYVCEFDANKTFIQRDNDQTQITTTSNTYFLQFNTRSSYGNVYKNDIAIYNKSLLVQDKAKLVEIQGNSCVVNQGLRYGRNATYEQNGFTLTQTSNGVIRVNGTSTSDNWFHLTNNLVMYLGQTINAIDYFSGKSNHVFLLYGMPSNTPANVYMGFVDSWGSTRRDTGSGVILNGYPLSYCQLAVKVYSGLQLNNFDIRPQIVDLTQQFPFDTPTSLNDPRVKRIIEQGYIPYNSGEIKDSVVGEVVANGYNLFDKDDTTLRYNSLYITSAGETGGVGGTNFSIVIPIKGGFTYIVERASVVSPRFRVCSIDEIPTGSFTNVSPYYAINDNGTSLTIPTRQSDNYLIINLDTNETNFTNQLSSLCIHFTGTRTGYADYIPQQYLPSEYQEVEYLESSGTQAIDTGVYNSDDNEFEIDFAIGDTSANRNYVIGGASSNPTVDRTQFSYSANAFIGWGENSHTTLTLNVDINKHKILMNKSNFVLDNVVVYTPNDHTFLGTDKSYLFAMVYSNSVGSTTIYTNKLKIYKAKIKNNGTLIRNFVPCYRKSDNVAGLYDLVNRLFYTNNGTGTFNVGKKVNNNTMIKLPAPLDLGGARNSHNKFEITKTEYVFTRNIVNYTFTGSETLTEGSTSSSGQYRYSYRALSSVIKLPSDNNDIANIMSSLYQSISSGNSGTYGAVQGISVGTNGYVFFYDSNYQSSSAMLTHLTGSSISYQLATPQVITIPRKHLGCVDLSLLNFADTNGAGNTYVSFALPKPVANNNTVPNMFSSYGITMSYNVSWNGKKVVSYDTAGRLWLKFPNEPNLTSAQIKQRVAGIYLFYETQNEVQDFNDEMLIQSGGTVNGEWFSWKQNQLCSNTTNTETRNGIIFTNNGNGSWTISGTADADIYKGVMSPTAVEANHYFLLKGCPVGGSNSTYSLLDSYGRISARDIGSGSIAKSNTAGQLQIAIFIKNGTVISTPITFLPNLIDLTKGFGSGNEPTSINDPRIQFIINNGYIPTDTNGTDTSITCEVLPNLTLNLKSK